MRWRRGGTLPGKMFGSEGPWLPALLDRGPLDTLHTGTLTAWALLVIIGVGCWLIDRRPALAACWLAPFLALSQVRGGDATAIGVGLVVAAAAVALGASSGRLRREGVVKAVPVLVRPLIKRFYSRSVLTAARSLPVVGRYLLQRNAIKIGIPLVGVPLAIVVNRYTTLVAGRHARLIFRNEARVRETAENLSQRSSHPQLTLWIAWLVVMADGKISDNEALLIRHLVRLMKERHDVADERLAGLIDVDHAEVWRLLADETADVSGLVAEARQVADVDGAINDWERAVITELEERCSSARGAATPELDADIR